MTKRFGEVAIELGIVTPEQVATALTMQAEQERSGQPRSKIGELLKELSSLNDEQINRVLARMREVPLTNGLGKTEAVSASPGPAAAAELMALEPGQKLGHFSVRRFHARGGLGQVWVVYDELLGRDVALKVMRPELESNPQARRRFLNEAQIAGQLEHPNIVPVYELGCTPEGRPYYAMKFVPGRTLADSIRRYHARPVADPDASLEWRKLLEAFVGVCRAIAYAHEHGVIHRDLKPSNVMWGDYGEAVVLDWGLAKRLPGSGSIVQSQPPADEMKEPIHEPNKLTKSSETSEVFGSAVKLQVAQSAILASLQEQTDRTSTDPEDAHQPPTPPEAGITRTGDVLGIVPFMPPEQAAGDVDQVDARSDVYSLGAMLYAILTNRRPFTETDKARLLVQVLEQEPPRPRQVNGRVPRPLAAICLKAMARHKAGRYATAQELAHDVERWLADEPVSVYRGGWNERLARWARRNRSRATAAMTALLLITFISAWSAIMIHSASQETERQRIQAEKSFQQARRAIDDLSSLVEDQRLKELPGLRRELFARADAYYREFLQFLGQRGDDPMVAQELGSSYHKLADLLFASGEIPQALQSYRNALKLRDKLVQQQPDRADLQKDLALTYHGLAVMQSELGQAEDALGNYDKASEIGEKLARDDPDNTEIQRLLALNYNGCANLHLAARRLPESLRLLEQAEGLLDRLVREQRGDATVRWTLAGIRFNLGRLKSNNPEEALRWHERSRELREQLVRGDPGSSLYEQDLASSLSSIGILLSKSGRTDAAIPLHHRARDLRDALVRRDPQNATYQKDLSAAFTNLAHTLQLAGRPEEALAASTQSLKHAKAAFETAPQVAVHRQFLIIAYYNVADMHLKLGHPIEAAEAIAARQKLVAGDAEELYDVVTGPPARTS